MTQSRAVLKKQAQDKNTDFPFLCVILLPQPPTVLPLLVNCSFYYNYSAGIKTPVLSLMKKC